jgi:hypothetical protein
LAANEEGGTLVLLDPEGNVRGTVPELEDDGAEQ